LSASAGLGALGASGASSGSGGLGALAGLGASGAWGVSTVLGCGLSTQRERQESLRLGLPLLVAPRQLERFQLLFGGEDVASGVPLPARTHCGRVALADNRLVFCEMVVSAGHEEDAYPLAAELNIRGAGTVSGDLDGGSGTTEEVARTLGAAASGGKDMLWRAHSVGYVHGRGLGVLDVSLRSCPVFV